MLMKQFLHAKSTSALTLLLTFFLSIFGASSAWADAKNLPYSYGFENYDLAAEGWTTQNPSGKNDSEFAIYGAAKKTGSYGFRFSSYNDSGENTQYLISPELNAASGGNLTFEYASSKDNSYGNELFKVGYSTTDNSIESFTWGEEIKTNSTTWKTYEGEFPEGTKYVAIYYYSKYQYRLYVDDFTFTSNVAGPAFTVKNQPDGSTFDMGLVDYGASKSLTLTNPGTESVTVDIATTDGFTASTNQITIAAKSEVSVSITVPKTSGTGTITFTPTVAEIAPITINLTCTVMREGTTSETFDDNQLPEDWELSNGNVTYIDGTVKYGWSAATITTASLVFLDGDMIALTAKLGSNSPYYYITVNGSADNGETWTAYSKKLSNDVLTTNFTTVILDDIPTTVNRLQFVGYNAFIDKIAGVPYAPVAPTPKFKFEAADYEFGFVIENTPKTFTISNTGTAELTGLTAEVTGNFSVEVANTIDAKSTTELTVTLLTTEKGAQQGVVTIKVGEEEKAKFNVSGYVADDTKFFENFSGNTLPDGWTITNNTYWKIENGVAKAEYNYSNKSYLVTPTLIVFGTDDKLVFQARQTGSFPDIVIEKSTNGKDWTQHKKISDLTTSWQMYTIEGLEAGSYQFRFLNDGYDLDNFNGFALNTEAPVMGVFSDEACETAATLTETMDYEFITESKTITYYIKNTGTGTLVLNDPTFDEPLTATLDKKELTEGQVAKLTINLSSDAKGVFENKTVSVTAADEVGTFTASFSAVIVDETKFNIDFATDELPDDWTNDSEHFPWTKNEAGYISTSSTAATLTTAPLIATAEEDIIIRTEGNALSVSYKAVGDEEWKELGASTWSAVPKLLKLKMPSEIESGKFQLQFKGNSAKIYRIYGLTTPLEPKMSIAPAIEEYDFQMQTTAAEYDITVSNTGSGTLEGVKAELKGEDFEVALSIPENNTATINEGVATIPAGQSINVKVTLKQSTEYKTRKDTLTISTTSEGIEAKSIVFKGMTRDGEKEMIDFAIGEWPEGWKHEGWTISDQAAKRIQMEEASFVTTTIKASEIYFDAKRAYATDEASLKVRYSTDGATTWSEAVNFYDITSAYQTFKLDGLDAEKNTIVEFTGANVYVDNIYGFVSVQAPILSLTENGVAVKTSEVVDFGSNLQANPVAKVYTLTNTGNADLKSTIVTEGDVQVTVTKDEAPVYGQLTLAPSETATITVNIYYEAPYGDMEGKVSIVSEDGVGTVEMNFKVNFTDPDALIVDFNDNTLPHGWYNGVEGNWNIANGYASVFSGVEKDLITAMVGAEEGKNVLSFEAWSKNETSTLKVYTSTDRRHWSEAQTFTLTTTPQTFALEVLADGNYYVSFTSSNASVDNIKGLKKLAVPAHDFFIIGTDVPEKVETTADFFSATVTLANLGSNENDVKVEVFFDGISKGSMYYATINQNTVAELEVQCAVPDAGTYQVKIKVSTDDGTYSVETEEETVTVSIPTGIDSITKQSKDGKIFNLNGMRVYSPKKGRIYIMNGKKTIVK